MGFTLIELLVVVTIIVILLAILVPALEKAVYQAQMAKRGANMKGIANSVSIYTFDFKRNYPVRALSDMRPFNLSGPRVDGGLFKLDGGGTYADDRVTLQPYLGAFGHLVVIRTGDLAYLHVHPEEGEGLHFLADVPTAGTYRAFSASHHAAVVRTAAFSVTAH